jgi:hypothetical protein
MLDSRLAKSYLDRLQKALSERGLEVGGHGLETDVRTPALVAKNPAVIGTDVRGTLLSPGLTQKVELRELAGHGAWWWCWVWAAPKPAERGAPIPAPEYEPLCVADDIEQAARRITTVLGVRDGDTTGEPSHA